MYKPVLPVIYEEFRSDEMPPELQNVRYITKGEKLRIYKDSLQVDNRKFQFIIRNITGDSREKIYQFIVKLYKKYRKSLEIRFFIYCIIENLMEVYHKDKKFIEKLANL